MMDWNKTESLQAMTVPNGTPSIFIAAPPVPPTFVFYGPDNTPMVTIRPTGEVELAPGLEISEASRLFWQGLADAFPAWKASAMKAERTPEANKGLHNYDPAAGQRPDDSGAWNAAANKENTNG